MKVCEREREREREGEMWIVVKGLKISASIDSTEVWKYQQYKMFENNTKLNFWSKFYDFFKISNYKVKNLNLTSRAC